MLPNVTSFAFEGYGQRSSLGRPFVPPNFTLLLSPNFSGERFRGIHTNSLSLKRSPGHYPGVRPTHLCIANLPTTRRGLFARGCGGITLQVLGGSSPCLCRQWRRSGSGHWPGRLESSNSPIRTSPTPCLCACPRRLRGTCGSQKTPPTQS
jgi:hypothetical protein